MSGPIGVIGKSGQVARALLRIASERGDRVVVCGRPELDLSNASSIEKFFEDVAPSVVINAAAFTAVDKAETEREEAVLVNATGVGVLARVCASRNIPLLHISTDYVFDGSKHTPYVETDLRKPLGVYGASKAAGEVAIEASAPRHIILRTAWVYGVEGNNFVHTMLRLGQEREELGVVSDQQGTPTFADDIAKTLLDLVPRLVNEPAESDVWGLYHFTGGGKTTWYGFAGKIFLHAKELGFKIPRLKAITTAEYPTPARRPAYSVLDCSKIERVFGITPAPWEETLERAIVPIIEQHKS